MRFYQSSAQNSHMMENVLYNEPCLRGYSVDVGLVEI